MKKRVTAALLGGFLLVARAQQPISSLMLWVTVDQSGSASTVTPHTTVADSKTTVISAAPASLTDATAFTLTTRSGASATTVIGTPPLATAANSNGEGAVLVCRDQQSLFPPFCVPQTGTVLQTGTTVYVTWDPTFFAGNGTVEIHGALDNTEQGFTSPVLLSNAGFWPWTIPSSMLSVDGVRRSVVEVSLTMAIFLVNPDGTNTNTQEVLQGPSVSIVAPSSASVAASSSTGGTGTDSGARVRRILVIVLPSVLGTALLVLFSLAIWRWRRTSTVLPSFGRRADQGYGVGQSRPQRTKTGRSAFSGGQRPPIRLVDQNVMMNGRNFFREEVSRQQGRMA